jgi:hypothetical protein
MPTNVRRRTFQIEVEVLSRLLAISVDPRVRLPDVPAPGYLASHTVTSAPARLKAYTVALPTTPARPSAHPARSRCRIGCRRAVDRTQHPAGRAGPERTAQEPLELVIEPQCALLGEACPAGHSHQFGIRLRLPVIGDHTH